MATTQTIDDLVVASLQQIDQYEGGAVAVIGQCIEHGANLTDLVRLADRAGWDFYRLRVMFERRGVRL